MISLLIPCAVFFFQPDLPVATGIAPDSADISVLIHPDYLSYFNGLAGGPEKGIHYFADSNIDWGEDIKGLKVHTWI